MITENDELRIYRGNDFVISEHIIIHHPTLDEICDYGEQDYYSMVYQLTSTPQNMKSKLWDKGIDYTKISPWGLFYNIIFRMFSRKETSIIFGDLDFQNFQVTKRDDGSVILYQTVNVSNGIDEIVIDESIYNTIMDYLRKIHGIEKDERMPGNESTKMVLIEDEREELELNKHKKYHSQLKNLISAMVNSEGFKYNHSQVWGMKINAFMDSVKRILKTENAKLLLQSGYSGFGINLKEIDQKQIDWTGELD